MRYAIAGALLSTLLAVFVVGWRVRTQRARSWIVVESLCACNRPTLAQMSRLRAVAAGGLDRVLTAQAHTLMGECEALRIAVARRSVVEVLWGSPLRVEPTAGQQRAARELTRALGLLCGDEHRNFWESLRTRVAEGAPAGDIPPEVLREAREHLRVRNAMCASSQRLSARPERYSLSLAEAERSAARCGR